jgi:hypothetical protein
VFGVAVHGEHVIGHAWVVLNGRRLLFPGEADPRDYREIYRITFPQPTDN